MSERSAEFKKRFQCTGITVVDDPDLGKGAFEITITEITTKSKPKIVKILLTRSQAERQADRRKNPEAEEDDDQPLEDKDIGSLLADDI